LLPLCFCTTSDTAFRPVEARKGTGLLDPVFDILLDVALGAEVAHAHGLPVAVCDDQVLEVAHVAHAARGAQSELAALLVDAAARQLEILARERLLHVGDREVVGLELARVDRDLHGAWPAAHDADRADARQAAQLVADLPVRDVRELAQVALSGHDDRQYRRRVEVELVDDRRLGAGRQQRQDRVDLALHFLLGHVAVLLEQELHRDERAPLGRRAAQFVDARDRVDRVLDELRDAGLHLLDRGAGSVRRDHDDRQVDVREQVDADAQHRDEAEHDGQQAHHHGEDRTTDAERRQAHLPSPALSVLTGTPSASRAAPLVTT
jgi:hypothetical protein